MSPHNYNSEVITPPFNIKEKRNHICSQNVLIILQWQHGPEPAAFSEVILIRRKLKDYPLPSTDSQTSNTPCSLEGQHCGILQEWARGLLSVSIPSLCRFYLEETESIKQSWETAPRKTPEANFCHEGWGEGCSQ